MNGIDIAPRSELSPPIVATEPALPVDDLGLPKSKGLLGKFKSNSAVNKVSSGDSFFVEGSTSKKGTFSRISSKLREKKRSQATVTAMRKSSSDIFNKNAADAINDTLAAAAEGGGSGKSTLRGPPPSSSPPPLDTASRNAHDLFRFVLEHALDPDEKVLQSYVFTLAYFADPVHILSDLITEHDVAVASVSSGPGGGSASASAPDGEGEEVVSVNAERAMKVISYWVAHVWYQFEASEPLMNLLTHFVNVNLKGKRWGNRLSDTIETLVEGRKALQRTLDGLLAHGKGLASREDVFAEVDPDDQEDVGQDCEDMEDDEDSEQEGGGGGAGGGDRDSASEVAPKEDVTSTFVGAETYLVAFCFGFVFYLWE